MFNAAFKDDIPGYPTGNIENTGAEPRDMEIAGAVDGEITGRTITVLEGGSVDGTVGAESIVICGAVKGIVEAHSISVLSTAHVEGELRYDELTVTPGAHMEARCVPAA